MTMLHHSRLRVLLLYLLVGMVALVPRVLDLGGFVIEDEARYWIGRSHRFLDALETGDLAATAITTHPGVTTMWLGSAGIVLRRMLLEWGVLTEANFANMLALMRLPVALVHTAGVLGGYWLLRTMFAPSVALLAALLWAADPFVIAFSRVLHVDGLATTFGTLGMLAACYAWYAAPQQPSASSGAGWLVLSGICTGLAILSKSSAMVLPGAVVALACWAEVTRQEFSMAVLPRVASALFGKLAIWGGVCVVTLALVWPAVLFDPMRVYTLLRIGIEVEGGSPHVQGNFFLGREDLEPGPLFYPVALALRLTPLTLAGLLLLGISTVVQMLSRAAGATQETQRNHGDASTTARLPQAALAGFALLVILALSLFSKKLNRYLVLAFPAIDVLAAVGLVWGMAWLARFGGRGVAWRSAGLLALCVAIAIINAAWWHPYSIVAFNQALGGAAAGPRTFLIGSGEGLEQVAAWLNQQPDITGVVAASTMTPPLQPYLRDGAQSLPPDGDDLPKATGYVVVYVRNVWNGALPPFDQFYPHARPLHTVTIHGVEYAWVYQVPPPIAHTPDATFGSAIHLRGYEVDTSAITATGTLSLTVQWQADAPLSSDVMLFVHVLDAQGQTVGQTDVPPASLDTPTSAWQPGRVMTWIHPVPVSANLSPGDYWLSLGLYDPADGTRLELHAPPQPDAPDDGLHALRVPISLP